MNLKKQYNTIDILKFIMALLVIMIHVKPNVHSDVMTRFFAPLTSIAVPVFFIISSVLLFGKLNNGSFSSLLRYCKRIGLLYLCWALIDGWYILTNSSYFTTGIGTGIIDLCKDLIFATVFPGSWYLSASVMGVTIVYLLNKLLHPLVVFLITFIVAYYIYKIRILPEPMHCAYDWYASMFREKVHLSFPAQMIWISVGQIISLRLSSIENAKKILLPFFCVTFVVCLVIAFFFNCFELRFVMAVSVVCSCLLIEIPSKPIYKRLRNYSILMFFFHFSIAGKMRYFTHILWDSFVINWLFYLIVVAISILFADLVLRLEKNRYFTFLKYTH